MLKVDFDHYTTVSMFHSRMKMLNANEYAQVLWKAAVNRGNDPNQNALGIHYDYTTDANGHSTLIICTIHVSILIKQEALCSLLIPIGSRKLLVWG